MYCFRTPVAEAHRHIGIGLITITHNTHHHAIVFVEKSYQRIQQRFRFRAQRTFVQIEIHIGAECASGKGF